MENSSGSPEFNDNKHEWHFAHVVIAFMAGSVGLPLVMFGLAFLLFPEDLAYGNLNFWRGTLIGSGIGALIVYRRRCIRLGVAALIGASSAILTLLGFFGLDELINALNMSELD